jgi:hypothetical protein
MSQNRNEPGHKPEPDFHGAAIIDEHGREIPITESMIQKACQALEKAWQPPRGTTHQGT